MELSAATLRLGAHMMTLFVILAGMLILALAGKRGLDMRWRWFLVAALGCYAVWFFLLAISLKDAEFIQRGSNGWLFGGMELVGAGLAWAWLLLTVRSTFRLGAPTHPPRNIGAPTQTSDEQEGQWLPAQAL